MSAEHVGRLILSHGFDLGNIRVFLCNAANVSRPVPVPFENIRKVAGLLLQTHKQIQKHHLVALCL